MFHSVVLVLSSGWRFSSKKVEISFPGDTLRWQTVNFFTRFSYFRILVSFDLNPTTPNLPSQSPKKMGNGGTRFLRKVLKVRKVGMKLSISYLFSSEFSIYG